MAQATSQPTFEDDILPMLYKYRGPMLWRLDFASYEQVSANAKLIYDQISTKQMPPGPFDPLSQAQIDTFKTWMDQGCPRGG